MISDEGEPVTKYHIVDLVIADSPNLQKFPDDKLCQHGGYRGNGAVEIRRDDGTFDFDKIRAGSHVLVVSTGEGQCSVARIEASNGQKKTGVRITLPADLTVQGVVVDHETGSPLPGVNVSVAGVLNATKVVSVTDGTFRLRTSRSTSRLSLDVAGDRERQVPESIEVAIKAGATSVDVGEIRLLRGEWRRRMAYSSGAYLGMHTTIQDGATHVVRVLRDGAAAAAGVHPGDAIIAVGGVRTRGLRDQALAFLLGGPAGESRSLHLSDGQGRIRTLSVTLGPASPTSAVQNSVR